MPKVKTTKQARKELAMLDNSLRRAYLKQMIKYEAVPPKKRLKGNSEFLVGEVGQGRIICLEKGDVLWVVHVFATHKEYEKWYGGQ
ncbi:MAG: hypothetical protein ABIH83_05550 [Candidatus Micrarchaeota archaeon]